MSCRHLFQSQCNIFIDIADYKIGSHITLYMQSLISFNHDIDCGAITNSPAVRMAGIGRKHASGICTESCPSLTMPGALSHNKFVSDPVFPAPTAKPIVILVRASG
jgi:hypothetical protein